MHIKAILFDMDGLIFDSEGLSKTCWQHAVSEQSLHLPDEYYQHFIGVQDAECERMLQMKFADQLDIARFRKIRDNLLAGEREKGVAFKPGFDVLFGYLQQRRLKCALVTSSAMPQVEAHFSGSGYLSLFDAVITAEQVENGKPAPDCYRLACEQLAMAPAECLVLEDSNNGMRAGLDAGCYAVMIPDLLQPAADVAQRATAVLRSLAEVSQLLNETVPYPSLFD